MNNKFIRLSGINPAHSERGNTGQQGQHAGKVCLAGVGVDHVADTGHDLRRYCAVPVVVVDEVPPGVHVYCQFHFVGGEELLPELLLH